MRSLKVDEKSLINCLLKEASSYSFNLDNMLVEEMNDGGMGSIYLAHPNKSKEQRKMGKRIAEKQFHDLDSVPILVSLNVDKEGDLFELDIWKADFSPVKVYPRC